jgi:hypothetical protein
MISHYSYKADYEKAAEQAMTMIGAYCEGLEEIDRLMEMLKEANEILRSAHSIASRDGNATNWGAFLKRVCAVLEAQHKVLTDYFTTERDD